MANVKVQVKVTVDGQEPHKGKLVFREVGLGDVSDIQEATHKLVNEVTQGVVANYR